MKSVAINVSNAKDKEAAINKGLTYRQFTSTYEYGETLEECVKLYGEEVVLHSFLANDVIALQGKIRIPMQKHPEMTDEQLQSIVTNHKPGIKSRVTFVQDPKVAILNAAPNMDASELDELIKHLEASKRK